MPIINSPEGLAGVITEYINTKYFTQGVPAPQTIEVPSIIPETATATNAFVSFVDYFTTTAPTKTQPLKTNTTFGIFVAFFFNSVIKGVSSVYYNLYGVFFGSLIIFRKSFNQLVGKNDYNSAINVTKKTPMEEIYSCSISITEALSLSVAVVFTEVTSSNRFFDLIFPVAKTKVCYILQPKSVSVVQSFVNWSLRVLDQEEVFKNKEGGLKCYYITTGGRQLDILFQMFMASSLILCIYSLSYIPRYLKIIIQQKRDVLAHVAAQGQERREQLAAFQEENVLAAEQQQQQQQNIVINAPDGEGSEPLVNLPVEEQNKEEENVSAAEEAQDNDEAIDNELANYNRLFDDDEVVDEEVLDEEIPNEGVPNDEEVLDDEVASQ